jgi:hypothetical protein
MLLTLSSTCRSQRIHLNAHGRSSPIAPAPRPATQCMRSLITLLPMPILIYSRTRAHHSDNPKQRLETVKKNPIISLEIN